MTGTPHPSQALDWLHARYWAQQDAALSTAVEPAAAALAAYRMLLDRYLSPASASGTDGDGGPRGRARMRARVPHTPVRDGPFRAAPHKATWVAKLQALATSQLAALPDDLADATVRAALVVPLVGALLDPVSGAPFVKVAALWQPWLDACAQRWPAFAGGVLDALTDAASTSTSPFAGWYMNTCVGACTRAWGPVVPRSSARGRYPIPTLFRVLNARS